MSLFATSLFCLNVPSKHDARCGRLPIVGARSACPACVRANETLLSRLDFARSILYIRTDESRRGRYHISEAASGKERQNEMESQSMALSRTTGATKRPGFCARVDEEDRQSVGGTKRRTERHAKVCWDYLHVPGMEMGSLVRSARLGSLLALGSVCRITRRSCAQSTCR